MPSDSELFSLDKKLIRAKEEDLINDVKAFSKSVNGEPITARAYNKWKSKRFSKDTIVRKFGSWERACDIAGVKYLYHTYDEKELIDHFERVWRWRGQRLVQSDLLDYNKLHGTTIHPCVYARRWRSFTNFVKLFSQYKLGQITIEELIASSGEQPIRELISPRLRAHVLERDNYTCKDCGASPRKGDSVTLHVHHIIPVSEGGTNNLENLVTNCNVCNQGKSDEIISK